MKYLSTDELRGSGVLQELNRRFLHPLALAAEVNIENADGVLRVQDHRDDPEGVIFGPGVMDAMKYAQVEVAWALVSVKRLERLGYVVQPPPELGS